MLVGSYSVTASIGSVTSDAATLVVTAGPLARITISPSSASVTAGGSQAFTAEGFDAYGNDLGDYTSAVTWSITLGANGAWDSNIYTSATTGVWTVTATDPGLVYGTASLTVNPVITVAQGANGVITPGTTSVNYGGSQTFTITPNTGYSIASLTVDGSAVAVASSYTFSNVVAAHTITATFTINTYTITPSVGSGGNEIFGNSNNNNANSGIAWAGYMQGSQFTLSAATFVTAISVKAEILQDTYLKVAIYSDNNGQAYTLLVQSAWTYVSTGNVAWITISLPSAYFLSAGTYWLFFGSNDTTGAAVKYYWDNSGATTFTGSAFTYPNFPNPCLAAPSLDISIAIYAIGGGGSISPGTAQTVDYGGSQSFTITANTGCYITDVVVGSTDLGPQISPYTYTFSNVQADTTISASFAIDTTPPSVSITSPSAGYVNVATVPVSGTASDSDSGIASVVWQVDSTAGTWTAASGTTSWSFTTGTLSQGVHTIYVKATDGAGNTYTTYVVVTVDTVAPVVTITAPLDGGIYNTAGVPAGAFSVVDTLSYTVVQSGWVSSPDGIYTYTVTATDAAGNVGSASVTYTIDNVKPVVTISAPLNGGYYNTADVPVGAYSVVDTLSYTVVQSGWVSSPDGIYTYTVTATDAAGNVGSASVTYTIDNVKPVVTISAPLNGGYYNTADVPVGAYSVVDTLSYTVVQSGWVSSPDGIYTYTVTATDAAGNVGSASVTYTIDNVKPVVTISAPLNGGYYNTADVPVGAYSVVDTLSYTVVQSGWVSSPDGIYTYTVTATDAAGNVGSASVTYTIDNVKPVVTISAPLNGGYYNTADVPVGAYSVVDTLSYTVVQSGWVSSPDGIYTYTVTATDAAGNVGSASVTYTIDNVKPVVTISAPLNGGYYNTADVPVGAYSVVDTLSYTVVQSGWVSSPDGIYTYTVTATDAAGNVGSASVTYTIDNVKPVVTISAPLNGGYYNTADVPVGAYSVVDTLSYTVVQSGWVSSPDGIYTYTVTATDAAGNVGSASVTYTIDNVKPVVTISAPLNGGYYNTADVPVGAYSVVDTLSYTVVQSGWVSSPDGIYTYTVTATDAAGNVGSASVTYTIDNVKPVVTISAPLNGGYYNTADVPVGAYSVVDTLSYTVVQSGWVSSPDGIYTYTVTATDAAGNVGSASVTYTIDNVKPVVTISAPLNGGYYNTADVPVGAYSVVDTLSYTVVQSGWVSSPDGIYTYTVTATDAAGNVGSASVTYTIDNVKPVVTISAPLNGGYYNTADVPVGAYSVVDTLSYTVVQSGWVSSPDGIYTYTVTATDAAGNVGSASVTYTIDNVKPVVTISAPLNGGYYNTADVPVGAYSVVDTLSYTVVQSGWVSSPDGIYTYTVTATDAAGNVGSASVTYTIDNVKPVVTISAPLNGGYYNTADVPVGAYSVVDTLSYTVVQSGWVSSPDGIYTYTVTATDAAGNVGSASVTYTIDNVKPVVTISAPLNGGYYNTADVPVGAYSVVDTLSYTVVQSGWVSSPDGIYTYTVTATDAAGNVGSASVTYTIDNVKPVVTITAPLNGGIYNTADVPAGAYTVSDSLSYTVVTSGWESSPGTYTYTVTATDAAGNVGSASVTYTNQASSNTGTVVSQGGSIVLGGSVTDTATVAGVSGFAVPTGTVDFYVSINGGSTWTQLGGVVTLVGGQATSIAYTPSAAGLSYEFYAAYSGDSNYLASQSGYSAEPLMVNKYTPITTTLLSSSTITLGGSVTDTATVAGVSGFAVPTGTVDFYVSINGGSTWTQLGGVVTLVGGQATSIAYTPSAAGLSYEFYAAYSGDSNYLASQSGYSAEPLMVNKYTPITTTLLSSSTITLGGSVTDTATVAGVSGFAVPTGTVDFYVSINGGSTWTQLGGVVTLVGGQATSIAYTPSAAGLSYEFYAAYSGDSNYLASQSGYSAEPLMVNKYTPITTTLLSSSTITLGGSVTDTATVAGVSGFAVPTGTVDFYVSINGGSTWTQLGGVVTLVGGQATSIAYTPSAAGLSYEFYAAYSGDSNYLASQSGYSAEPLMVNKYTPITTTLLSSSTITLGGSVTDTATVAGVSGFAVPTGTVDFYVSINGGSTWTQLGGVVTLVGGQATSIAYTPSAAGLSYEFYAAYSGDSNYLASQSGYSAEPLMVNKYTPITTTLLSSKHYYFGRFSN